jgi:hypothetical protein
MPDLRNFSVQAATARFATAPFLQLIRFAVVRLPLDDRDIPGRAHRVGMFGLGLDGGG